MADFNFTVQDLIANDPTPFMREQNKYLVGGQPFKTSRSVYGQQSHDLSAPGDLSTLTTGQILMGASLYDDPANVVAKQEYMMSNMLGAAEAGSPNIKGDNGSGLGAFDLIAPSDVKMAAAVNTLQQQASAQPNAAGGDPNAPTPVAGQAGSSASGDQVVQLALTMIGTPYLWGGTDPNRGGVDCSGFTQWVFQQLGMQIGRNTGAQWGNPAGQTVTDLNSAQPGDLVFFGDPSGSTNAHVGIYIGLEDGNPTMVDAPHTGASVRKDNISAWSHGTEHFWGIKRFTIAPAALTKKGAN